VARQIICYIDQFVVRNIYDLDGFSAVTTNVGILAKTFCATVSFVHIIATTLRGDVYVKISLF
jgi:hypothetical protein